jgi:hypothetical protein
MISVIAKILSGQYLGLYSHSAWHIVIVSYPAHLHKVIFYEVKRRSNAMPQNLNNGAEVGWKRYGRSNITRQGRAARLESPLSEDLTATMLSRPVEVGWFSLRFIYPFQVSGSVDKFQTSTVRKACLKNA